MLRIDEDRSGPVGACVFTQKSVLIVEPRNIPVHFGKKLVDSDRTREHWIRCIGYGCLWIGFRRVCCTSFIRYSSMSPTAFDSFCPVDPGDCNKVFRTAEHTRFDSDVALVILNSSCPGPSAHLAGQRERSTSIRTPSPASPLRTSVTNPAKYLRDVQGLCPGGHGVLTPKRLVGHIQRKGKRSSFD
jgi:hypothetical protein